MTKATVMFNGTVLWEPPAVYKSSCEIDVQFFPYDKQNCSWRIGAWTYDRHFVDLEYLEHPETTDTRNTNYNKEAINLDEYHRNVEWEIIEVPAIRQHKAYPCCPSVQFTDITFFIVLRRKTLFYTVNFVIPCVCLTVLSVCLFYLPVVSGEKISLGVNLLVSQTLFFLLLSETIPPTSLVVPLLGKYILFSMILVSMSVSLAVYVLNVHYRKPGIHKMHKWVRHVFLDILPGYLMMRRPHFQKDRSYQAVQEIGRRFSTVFTFQNDTINKRMKRDEWKTKCPEIFRAMSGVQFIATHIQKQDEIDSVREACSISPVLFI